MGMHAVRLVSSASEEVGGGGGYVYREGLAGLNDDPTNEDRVAVVHELMEVARASKSRRFWLAADPLSRVAIGLTVTAVVCFSLLTAINGPPSPPPDTPAASLQRGTRLELYTKSLPQARSTVGPMSTPRQLPDVDTRVTLCARLAHAGMVPLSRSTTIQGRRSLCTRRCVALRVVDTQPLFRRYDSPHAASSGCD